MQELYIVNAGRMNHGKISLFNALLDREEKMADIRQTVRNRKAIYYKNVFLVDIPDLMRIRLMMKKRITFIRMRILPYMCIFLVLVVNYIKVNGIIFFGWQIYMMIPDYFLSHFAFVMTFAEKFNFGKESTCEEIMHQVESMFQEKFSGAREEVFGHECVVSTGRLR